MKRKYKIDGLDCATCALKIERKIQTMPAVEECSVNFATGTILVETADNDSQFDNELVRVCKRIIKGIQITPK